MIFKGLQRFMQEHEQSQSVDSPAMKEFLNRVRDKPFWLWNKTEEHERRRQSTNGNCCFNHIIGLPKKNGQPQPFWDYQQNIYYALFTSSYVNFRPPNEEEREKYNKLMVEAELKSQSKKGNIKQTHQEVLNQRSKELVYPFKVKHCWIKKASSLGISELILRIMVWLCVRNDNSLNSSHMCIVCGPRIEIAIELCNRIRKLFEPHGIFLDGSMTSIKINNVTITAYPSNHLDSMRGLDKVSFIFMDEADFFARHEQENARTISERYIAKSDPYIVMVSTPNRPDGLFAQIEKEPYDTCLYKKLMLHYSEGVGKIYTNEEIENAKMSPSFPREYCLEYQGQIGNVISPAALERCIELGEEMNKTAPIDDWRIPTQYVMGIDPGYGSSNTAVTVSRFINGKVQIIYNYEWTRVNFSDVVDEIFKLKIRCNELKNILVDASASEMYTALCNTFNQNPSMQYLAEKQNQVKKLGKYGQLERYLFVCPIPFQTKGQDLLSHTKWLVEETDEDGKAMVGIDKRFERVITSLRTAQAVENHLDKGATVHDDTFDSLRLNLSYYRESK